MDKRFFLKKMTAVSLALLILLFCSCTNITYRKNEKNDGITPDYFSAGRFAATVISDGSSVFFARKNGIYKQSEKGAAVCMVAAVSPDLLLIDEGRLYFTGHTQQEILYSVNLDGSDFKEIFRCDQMSEPSGIDLSDYCVIDGVLYAANGRGAFSYRLHDRKFNRLVDDRGVSAYAVRQNTFYYIDHTARTFTIYGIDLSNNRQTVVLGEARTEPERSIYYDFWWLDERLYVAQRNPNGLYDCTAGETPVLVDPREMEAVWQQNGTLYYVVETGGGKYALYAYDHDKSDAAFVSELSDCDFSNGLRIVNHCLYYSNENSVQRLPV